MHLFVDRGGLETLTKCICFPSLVPLSFQVGSLVIGCSVDGHNEMIDESYDLLSIHCRDPGPVCAQRVICEPKKILCNLFL